MQELKEILEEIEEATRQEDAPIYCGNMEVDGYVRKSVVEDIIRKYITGSDTAMMENKTIEVLKNNYPKMCKMVNGRYQGGFDDTECDFGQALTIAISALKEIQQYRKIGTVEEIKSAKKYIDLKKRYGTPTNTIDVCAEYVSIGTVEEYRTAMEYWKYLRERRCGLDAVVEKCMQYEQIGTVKECREAVEKQKPQKPKDSLKIDPVIDENGAYVDADTTVYLLCPSCREMVGIEDNCDRFCRECGQAIDKNLEEMEDGA